MKVIGIVVAFVLSASAGVGGWIASGAPVPWQAEATLDMAWIDSPHDGDVLPVGKHVVNSHAASPVGIVRMYLSVNGRDDQVNERPGGTLEKVDWTFEAPSPGTYELKVWGVTTEGNDTAVSIVTVYVIDPADFEASVPEPSPEPTKTKDPEPTETEKPKPTATETADPGPCTPKKPTLRFPADWAEANPEGGSGTATLGWKKNGSCEVVEWKVQVARYPDDGVLDFSAEDIQANFELPGSQKSLVVHALSCEGYYWRVRAIGEDEKSSWSAVRVFEVIDC